jgi:hypothetical protein
LLMPIYTKYEITKEVPERLWFLWLTAFKLF